MDLRHEDVGVAAAVGPLERSHQGKISRPGVACNVGITLSVEGDAGSFVEVAAAEEGGEIERRARSVDLGNKSVREVTPGRLGGVHYGEAVCAGHPGHVGVPP